jgi:hypothetical protein
MRPPSLRDKLNELLEAGLVEGVFMAVQPHMLDGPARLQTLAPVTEVGMVSPGGISGIEFVALLEENRYSAVSPMERCSRFNAPLLMTASAHIATAISPALSIPTS